MAARTCWKHDLRMALPTNLYEPDADAPPAAHRGEPGSHLRFTRCFRKLLSANGFYFQRMLFQYSGVRMTDNCNDPEVASGFAKRCY